MNTDLGNVVLGLECCRPIWFESVKCKNKCPYDVYGHDEGGCVDHLIYDALSLLKEQEPRLLKADDFVEADGWGNIPAWYEHNPSLGIKTIDGWGIIKRGNLQDKATRYWNSRPTETQMEATPWEPPKEG